MCWKVWEKSRKNSHGAAKEIHCFVPEVSIHHLPRGKEGIEEIVLAAWIPGRVAGRRIGFTQAFAQGGFADCDGRFYFRQAGEIVEGMIQKADASRRVVAECGARAYEIDVIRVRQLFTEDVDGGV